MEVTHLFCVLALGNVIFAEAILQTNEVQQIRHHTCFKTFLEVYIKCPYNNDGVTIELSFLKSGHFLNCSHSAFLQTAALYVVANEYEKMEKY
jgi:hypothetical protein